MICRNGRIFRDLSTILVDNKPIIEEVVTLSHNVILVLVDFWEVVTLSDDAVLVLADLWEDVTLSHNAILVLPDFWEGVTMPDDGIRMNPGTKVEILRLSRQNWR